MPTFLVTPTKAFVALAAFVGTHCLAARTLYLVAGSPSHGPETHAVVLYSLVNGKSTVIRTLVTEAEGSRNIHLNYEARRVVVTSSTEAPLTRISIVDMDHPDTELSIDLGQTGDFGVSDEGFLDVPGQGHLYYVSRGDVSTASQKAYAFNLEGSLELAPLPDRLLKFRRSFGYALFESDEFWIAYDPQSGAVTMRTPSDARSIDLLPPVPPALRTPGATWARIGACNSFMTALVLPDGRALVYSVRSGWMSSMVDPECWTVF